MTDETTIPEEETNTFYRYAMIGIDGVYDGMIAGVSSLGYVVDAANHLPMVLNVLPGEQGFSTFHDRPFLGSEFIYDNLTGGMDAYQDTMGIVVPEPVTLSEHLVHGTGEAVGLATTVVATGAVLGAANTALVGGETVAVVNTATKVSPITSAFTAVVENPVVQAGTNAATYIGSQIASLAGRFAIANPLLTSGLAAGADITFNDGRIVTPVAKSGVNYLAESFGLGTIFRDSSDPDSDIVPGPANLYGLVDDPAKTAAMLGVVLATNSILNNFLGGTLGLIASIAIALVFNKQIGNAAHTALDAGREMIDGLTAEEPVPVPVPAAAAPRPF